MLGLNCRYLIDKSEKQKSVLYLLIFITENYLLKFDRIIPSPSHILYIDTTNTKRIIYFNYVIPNTPYNIKVKYNVLL